MPRWGAVIRMPGGGVVFVDGSGPRPKVPRCFCGCGRASSLQCDFPLLVGGTCDRYLCRVCAVAVGPDRDYCPGHPRE